MDGSDFQDQYMIFYHYPKYVFTHPMGGKFKYFDKGFGAPILFKGKKLAPDYVSIICRGGGGG